MKYWILPIAQTVFVALLVVSFYAVSWFGDEYVLRAEPFDPFDPFYGEYVMLQYPDLTAPSSLEDGEVYFTLREGADGYAEIDRIQNESFFGAIRGTMWGNEINTPQLQQFYVEQGLGPDLEEARTLQVTLDIAPWGSIRPRNLEVRDE